MIREKQEAPNQIELEFVYGCNMGCSFCGLMGVVDGFTNHRFIAPQTLNEIVNKIAKAGWKSKIVISGHGEPMLHPNAVALVQTIKSILPKNHLSMITNGTNLTQETVIALFNAGLDNLAVDEYTKSDNADKTRKLVNRCGSAFPKDNSAKNSKCSKPFREMFLDYEGNLLLCCHDFRREVILGNITDYDTLEELWNNPIIEMYRKLLYNKCRSIFPCQGCNAKSFRVGLLPDKFGKLEMPDWTEKDDFLYNNLIKRTEDTKLRSWEKQNEHNT